MRDIIERELPGRLSILRRWADDLLIELKTGGPVWANPFSRELLLSVLQKFCTDPNIAGPSSVLPEHQCYSAWLKREHHNFVPVAFSCVNVWKNEDRATALRLVANRVNDSISRYFDEVSVCDIGELSSDMSSLTRSICSEIRFFHNLGRRFHLYGGVLAIETIVRFVEKRMEAVLPEIHECLGWDYSVHDFAIDEYLRNTDEAGVERLFVNHWMTYISSLPSPDVD